jgi:esterase/lipase superfamily enzyme
MEATNAGKQADTPEALVFVHGYNVNFNDAVRRAAQIAYDLEFAGIPMVYRAGRVTEVA